MKQAKFKDKLKYYEQKYFTHDLPIPFKGDLVIYPVMVPDYYKFYACIECFKLNKNLDIEGVPMSHLKYLFYRMQKDEHGGTLLFQFIQLLELIFHIKNGIRCPKCKEFYSYEQVSRDLDKLEKKMKDENITDTESQNQILGQYYTQLRHCEKCNCQKEDVIRYTDTKEKIALFINDVEISPKEYEELKSIVLYWNIPDWDDDYINPDLKKELDEVARLKNPNMVQPSLEKQECCIVASSSYTFETVKQLTIRKLVLLLRTVDTKLHYVAYRQGEMSGLVRFKGEIDHWIYSDDHKDKFKDIMTMDQLKNKLKDVT